MEADGPIIQRRYRRNLCGGERGSFWIGAKRGRVWDLAGEENSSCVWFVLVEECMGVDFLVNPID